MIDPRVKKLAEVLVDYSVFVKKGENVMISGSSTEADLIREIYRLVIKRGAYPFVDIGVPGMSYIYYKNASIEQLKKFPNIRDYIVRNCQKYIGIGSPTNTREFSNIDPKRLAIRSKVVRPITDYIVNSQPKMYRVTLDYPTPALAQDAEMSTEEYEDFLFGACLLDWKKLSKEFRRLQKILNAGKVVRIVGEDTDLTLRIYKKSFIVDDGKENMPGGEIFCAPEKFSAEGHIRFTYPAIRDSVQVDNIYLEFKKGKVVKATADKNEKFLKQMIAMDKGSCYLGELGIGMNPKITKFTKNLLFDEKIGGTIHLALGMAYKACGQPNKSALHWDIVKDLRRGGRLYLDGRLIQKDGKWLV
ncbi:MAG: aminopeptidase [Candidatus Aenigmatarchaeota archaeon]